MCIAKFFCKLIGIFQIVLQKNIHDSAQMPEVTKKN